MPRTRRVHLPPALIAAHFAPEKDIPPAHLRARGRRGRPALRDPMHRLVDLCAHTEYRRDAAARSYARLTAAANEAGTAARGKDFSDPADVAAATARIRAYAVSAGDAAEAFEVATDQIGPLYATLVRAADAAGDLVALFATVANCRVQIVALNAKIERLETAEADLAGRTTPEAAEVEKDLDGARGRSIVYQRDAADAEKKIAAIAAILAGK